MRKFFAVILLGLVVFTIWSLSPREQKTLREKPEGVVSAAKAITPVPAVPQFTEKQAVAETKPESSQVPIPIPSQSGNPNRIVDEDGVVLEEVVAAPDGQGKITRRYSYGEDGRLLKTSDIDQSGSISIWDYSYDRDGKVHIRVTDPEGNITTR